MKLNWSSALLASVALLAPAVAANAQLPGPVVFSPGVISGSANDASPAFTPDGKTVYFSREGSILVSHRRGDRWSTPEIASFSGQWRDAEPAMSPDGSFLIFASSRPITEGGGALDGSWGGQTYRGHGGNLWKVQRRGSGWGTPIRLPDVVNRGTAIFAPAIVADQSLYFMEATKTTKFHLLRSQYKDSTYQEPVPLAFTGAWSDVDPVVAPDESFMIFPSNRPPLLGANHNLFIAFRESGQWGDPKLMVVQGIDSSVDVNEARMGPDHHTLYFSTGQRTPIIYPRTRAAAERDGRRIQEWDNGLLNIWQIDATSWIQTRR